MESAPLDSIDHAILFHLQQDARKPLTEIADAVNVTDNTVRNRIEELEDRGAIQGYQVNVNYDLAGVQHHFVFICSARVRQREALVQEARQHPGVVEVITLMTGRENVLVIAAETEKAGITDIAYDLDEMGLDIEREYLIKQHDRMPFDGFELEENL